MEHFKNVGNEWAVLTKSIKFEKEMAESIECEICLEEYVQDELEEHREMCMARMMFQCTICNGDYVSKEGLWNHLDLHEIADEKKELHYQEIRATYKLHQCTLCNDYRGYQENRYWKHVREEHGGFFLRCSECGQSFRSQTLKTDHDLTHCKARKQTEGMNENLMVEKKECFEMNILNQQGAFVPRTNNVHNDTDSRLSDFSPAHSKDADNMGDNVTKKESKTLPLVISKSRSETKADSRKMSHQHVKNSSGGFLCEICGQKFKKLASVSVHIRRVHHIEGDFKNIQVDFMNCKNQPEQNRSEQIALKMEITVEPTTLMQHDDLGISTSNPSTVTECTDMSQYSKDKKEVVSWKNQHSSTVSTISGARDTDNNMTEMESEVMAENKNSQSLVENVTSEAKCSHCGKEFSCLFNLARHMEFIHQSYPCRICGIILSSHAQVRYHKMMTHTEPKHKCPQCPKKFYRAKEFQEHLSVCVSRRITCELCGLKFKNVQTASVHKKRIHHVRKGLTLADL